MVWKLRRNLSEGRNLRASGFRPQACTLQVVTLPSFYLFFFGLKAINSTHHKPQVTLEQAKL